jgi:hypothetical protein
MTTADLLGAFRAKCEARAASYAAGKLGLHEAVDALQDDAKDSGLIAVVGQDAVQWEMGVAFAAVRGMDLTPPGDVPSVDEVRRLCGVTVGAEIPAPSNGDGR